VLLAIEQATTYYADMLLLLEIVPRIDGLYDPPSPRELYQSVPTESITRKLNLG